MSDIEEQVKALIGEFPAIQPYLERIRDEGGYNSLRTAKDFADLINDFTISADKVESYYAPAILCLCILSGINCLPYIKTIPYLPECFTGVDFDDAPTFEKLGYKANLLSVGELNTNLFTSSDIEHVVSMSCTSVGYGSFSHSLRLASVDFPKCTFVGQSAFYMCFSLTSVSIPKCEHIEKWGFGNCQKLNTIDLPSVVSLNHGAFVQCKSLEEVYMPKVTVVDEKVFYGCNCLRKVVMREGEKVNGLLTNDKVKILEILNPDLKGLLTEREAEDIVQFV